MQALKRNFGFTQFIAVLALAAALLANISPIRLAIAQFNAPQTFLGTAGGTSSALTATIHNVTQASDILWVPLRIIPSGINPTGGATLALTLDSGSISAQPILKQTQTSGGLSALTGNEFQPGQVVELMWDGTEYQCLTCAPTVPAGSEIDFDGPNIPSGWLKADGSAQSRSTYSVLFNALNLSTAATTINGNATVTVTNSSLYQVGWFVGGNNITCQAQIISINTGANQITLNSTATNGGSTTLSIGPYGQGDCATTFNLPNRAGRTTAGADGSTNITSTTCTNPATLGSNCGTQTKTLITSNLPPYTPAGTVSLTNTGAANGSSSGPVGVGTGATIGMCCAATISFSASFSGTPQGGTSTPLSSLMPLSLVYKIIKTEAPQLFDNDNDPRLLNRVG